MALCTTFMVVRHPRRVRSLTACVPTASCWACVSPPTSLSDSSPPPLDARHAQVEVISGYYAHSLALLSGAHTATTSSAAPWFTAAQELTFQTVSLCAAQTRPTSSRTWARSR